jgi:quinoprotein glucose dehydrogenase
LLRDGNSRVRFFAALSLGKLSRREAFPAILEMLRENDNQDPYLRHAGVMALTGFGDVDSLVSAARDRSPAVRMGVLLAMRRLQRSEISMFLEDADPAIVLEAARAINDQPINGAMRDLAALSSSIIQKADESRSATSSSEPLLRRVLNANFHLGTLESAQALAAFASLSNATPKLRVEALDELSDWQHPSGRDRVVGLWRPVSAKRPLSAATEALQPTLSSLLRSSPDKVRIAASRAAGRLMITNATPILSDLVSNTNVSSAVRVEALKRLAELDPSRLENALAVAQADPDEDLRKAATPLFALVKSSNPAVRLEGILTSGTTGEQQASLAALGSLPGTEADEILSQWLERLRAGEVPKEIQLDLLEAASKRQADAVKQKLSDYNAAKSKDDPLAPYREVLFGGDATQGKKIFLERPDAQCVRCHKIDTEGGDVGPDLSHIGSQKDRQYLLESILLPNKQIAPGFDSVMVNTKGGDTYAGVLKSETDKELVLNSPDGGKVTVQKSDIESRRKALSPMPEGIGQILSKQDLRDLVEFLSGRK